MTKAFVSGCAGRALTPDEMSFFKAEQPWGLILFARNCVEPAEIAALTADFRRCVARADAPVLIDQEGGRVQRLIPPRWPRYPSAATMVAACGGEIGAICDLARLQSRLIAADLAALGITVNCLPVLDVRFPQTHDIIGDRSFGGDPTFIVPCARAQVTGMVEGGILPVMKHVPGHGRASVDSHLALPRVNAAFAELDLNDFVPFRAMADTVPMAMTAHIVFEALDPDRPATTSPVVIDECIRGAIGFDGLLMTDDLSMKALGGAFEDRARDSITAGCDMLLHCNGDMDEMRAVASAAPRLEGAALRRAETALRSHTPETPFDVAAGHEKMAKLLSSTA